ncbi:putative AAA domain (dynein-related subfamily)/von Willebrand factor type A domain containing protein [Trypanosoma cruzi]|nr:putative AAA domain (dynein-related subfamily)/von Willebrand factor type A domain containing protein [Trypanosoma cruzi]
MLRYRAQPLFAMLTRYTEAKAKTPFFNTQLCAQGRRGSTDGLLLTIGDITVPVPENLSHPENVKWLLPGIVGCGADTDKPDNSDDNSTGNMVEKGFQLHGGNAFFQLNDSTTRGYLRWMCQKEQLRQDMCLVGEPGPAMRWLVQMYSYLVRREMQCVSLNRDTTESDLGQRREIRNGTLVYDDQCVVVAAREGQLLLLEGLEKVERNVLPVINNLLENREMHLENGMMLIHPERYDRLLQELLSAKKRRYEHGSSDIKNGEKMSSHDAMTHAAAHEELRRMGFIRVSEHFRVVGITVPVPPYDGNPLDPPLRSRFQCLYVNIPLPGLAATKNMTASASVRGGYATGAAESLLKLRTIIDEVNTSTKDFIVGGTQAGNSGEPSNHHHNDNSSGIGGVASTVRGLQTIGSYELAVLSRQRQLFPDISLGEILPRAFPWMLYAQQTATSGIAHIEEAARCRREYERLLGACNIGFPLYECRHSSIDKDGDAIGNNHEDGVYAGEEDATNSRASVGILSTRGHARMSQTLREKLAAQRRRSSRGGTEKSTEEPEVSRRPEDFNDVLSIENIRVAETNCGAVVGDACIASREKGGIYRLPICMGETAMHTANGETTNSFLVAARCPTPCNVFTTAHHHVLQSMLQLHIAGQHILLLGPTGCGKTTLLREFAQLIGYRMETMYLYADMTNKDLFQRRTTDSSTGDTTWENSALVEAALRGRIAVLDGIDKLPHGMLASLQHLLVDGNSSLYDGTILRSQREYEILKQKLMATDLEMQARRIFPVHPAFRVVATARSTSSAGSSGGGGKANQSRWRVTHEVTSLFGLVMMPATTQTILHAVLSRAASTELETWRNEMSSLTESDGGAMAERSLETIKRDVDRLLRLRDALERLQETEPKVPQLSLRQLLHLIRFRVRHPDDFTPGVESTLLLPLMNTLTAKQVRQAMHSCGFQGVSDREEKQKQEQRHHGTRKGTETVADLSEGRRGKRHDVLTEVSALKNTNAITECQGCGFMRVFAVHGRPVFCSSRVYSEEERAMVPYVPYFHSNPVHESIIAWLAKQYAVGNNILLIGNQGVGKNKVVDAFLARIGVPRQYIQLHRDTTVGTLTINPTVEGGRVIWSDSPLVKAVERGHCLVVDEIDKAPVEVVQVLKGLVEDHEMRLRDGRQIRGPRARVVAADSDPKVEANVIAMHPDFRIIVLANPPGFPFHGNDFYRECGDLFASYVMGNPDALSQLRVLKAYGPNLPDTLLVRLISAFQTLQKSFEEGHLTYPFSLRELIAVVKHMAAFPHDGIYDALNNVFNFDARNENTLHLVRQVMHLHLSPLVSAGGMRRLLPLRAGQSLPLHVSPQSLQVPATAPLKLSTMPSVSDATLLPVRFLTDADCDKPDIAQSVPTWCEQYKESEFAAVVPNVESEGFTEWLAAPDIPFLRSGDVVVGIAPVEADVDMGALITLAVLFLREEATNDTSNNNSTRIKRLLLAMVAPPSVASFGMVTMRRSHLSLGQIQFFDLTRFFPAADFSSSSSALAPSLHAFNAEPHSSFLVTATQAGWLNDAFGAPIPLVAVVDAQSGLVLLINTTAAAVQSCDVSPRQQGEEEECTRGAVLPVRIAPPSCEPSLCLCSLRPLSGIVAMTRPRSPELFVWMNGQRIVVTLPAASIDKLQFVTDNLAMVSLRVGETVSNCLLKMAVSADGQAKASLLHLPDGISGDIVGFAGNQATALPSDHALLQPLKLEELKGAVVVPGFSETNRGDVVYMTLDEYSPAKRMWSVRLFTDADAAAAVCTGSLRVSHPNHQLLATEWSSAEHRGRIVAVDFQQHMVRRFAPPPTASSSSSLSSSQDPGMPLFALNEGTGVALWYDNTAQRLLVADVVEERVQKRYRNWSTLLEGSVKQIGNVASTTRQPLSMTYSKPRAKPSGTLKHGKEDDEEHHGGNTYAGGTGGTDTAGLGGIVGPYRLDKGWPVHQVSPEEKQRVPPHIIEEAKRMGKAALEERLREIGMSAKEYEQYRALQERVQAPVALLRSVLSGLKAAEGERTWLRGQTDGIWDDSKIVEGIVGERNIYKRREESTETNLFQSKHKKRLLFVLDVSASMYRFEGMDHRLTKLLESTVMVMEAFAGFEEKIDYAMVGHNGDSACIELVSFGHSPANQKARMEVCQRMVAHAQYCWSGDNTVEAMRQSIDLVTAEKGDAYLVFVISDANLPRYGIQPSELSAIMRSHKEVQMFCIFIATLGEQASNLQAEMPPGHGFECLDTQALPHILKQIFFSVNLL